MKRKSILLAVAVMAFAGLTFAGCKKDNKASSEASETTVEIDETTGSGDDPLTTHVEATEFPDGSVEIDNTLPTEVVTPDSSAPAKDEYTTTPSGLKYKVIKKGSGAHPTASSTVSVLYTGKLTDGTVFDSTDNHGGQPATFPLNRVIPGWTEGVQLMQPGAEYEFVIPANLAYGPQGVPGAIPPNATLVFDIKLLEIK